MSCPDTALRFACAAWSLASLMMKQMNSVAHSCIRVLVSCEIFAWPVCANSRAMILAILAIGMKRSCSRMYSVTFVAPMDSLPDVKELWPEVNEPWKEPPSLSSSDASSSSIRAPAGNGGGAAAQATEPCWVVGNAPAEARTEPPSCPRRLRPVVHAPWGSMPGALWLCICYVTPRVRKGAAARSLPRLPTTGLSLSSKLSLPLS